jgi:hypothetical protein
VGARRDGGGGGLNELERPAHREDSTCLTRPVPCAKRSYYTGKLKGYLRYKEIPQEFRVLGPPMRRLLEREVCAAQMPAVELPDGRFMTDTTPIIAWLEERIRTRR